MTGLPVVFGLIGRNMLSQALFHFVADRAGVFTDHHKSGRPILAKYKHLRTEHIPQRALRLFHNLMVVSGDRQCKVLPLVAVKIHLFLLIRSVSQHIFGMTFHIIAPSSDLFQRTCSFV